MPILTKVPTISKVLRFNQLISTTSGHRISGDHFKITKRNLFQFLLQPWHLLLRSLFYNVLLVPSTVLLIAKLKTDYIRSLSFQVSLFTLSGQLLYHNLVPSTYLNRNSISFKNPERNHVKLFNSNPEISISKGHLAYRYYGTLR